MQKRIHMFLFLILFSFNNSHAGWLSAGAAYAGVKINFWVSDLRESMANRQPRNQNQIQNNAAPRPNPVLVAQQRDAIAKATAIAFLITPLP